MLGKNGQLVVGYQAHKIDVSSLGANGCVRSSVGPTLSQQFRVSRIKGWVAADNTTADVGPLVFGLADIGLTVTEIQEAWSLQPTSRADNGPMEASNRKIFPLAGLFHSGEVGGVIQEFDTNDFPWPGLTLSESNIMWNMWAFNADQSSTMVAGDLNFAFKFWGVWL